MHIIQLDIFKHLIHVCETLGLRYFLVHGSLLGAIRTGKFMPFDDDIDLAMPRSDYDRLIAEGPKILDRRYFIQSSVSDENYPLEFTKVRDSNTTYITAVCRNIDMHHGVYIDIFPIDYVFPHTVGRKAIVFAKKLLAVRIGSVFSLENFSFKRKILSVLTKIFVPSWEKAVRMNEWLNRAVKHSPYIKLTGGKRSEQLIPAEWFSESEFFEFEGVPCSVPSKWHEYLTQIYGDYMTRTLLEDKLHDTVSVEINACCIDLEKPYQEYRGLL